MSIECPHCGSQRQIPIVYGNMRDIAMDLFDRGIIALGGSFATGASETWECADCWTRYGSPEDTDNNRIYLESIGQAFANYQVVSDFSRLTAKGLRILRLVTVKIFELGASEVQIESNPEGIKARAKKNIEWKEITPPPENLYGPIAWLIDHYLTPQNTESALLSLEYEARVSREDRRFRLTKLSGSPDIAFSITAITTSVRESKRGRS